MKKIIIILGILVLLLIIILGLVTYNKNQNMTNIDEIYEVGQVVNYEDWQFKINDAYYADYEIQEDYEFDHYLAVEFEITNLHSTIEEFSVMASMTAEDRNKEAIKLLVDENGKHFKDEVKPNDTWVITIVYPVDESAYYNIFYSYGPLKKEENVLEWKIDSENLKTKTVAQTTQHLQTFEEIQEEAAKIEAEEAANGGGE